MVNNETFQLLIVNNGVTSVITCSIYTSVKRFYELVAKKYEVPESCFRLSTGVKLIHYTDYVMLSNYVSDNQTVYVFPRFSESARN